MRERISRKERRKAQFITEYKELCKKYGAMVMFVNSEDYSFFALARTDDFMIEMACLEMLLEETGYLFKQEEDTDG